MGGEKCYLIDQIIDCNFQDSDFISIGHTHSNIPEERAKTIANYLSDEVRDREYIRKQDNNYYSKIRRK